LGCLRVTAVVGVKFVFARTARYVVNMLKLQCHYASFGKFYSLNVWIVLALLYLRVRVIFAMRLVHLYGKKSIFSITARYVIHILKLQCHYASFGKFYNLMCGLFWHCFI